MKKILCYGDSNTWGYDPRLGSGYRLPENKRWTGILKRTRRWDILNFGRNGRQIPLRDFEYEELKEIVSSHDDAEIFCIMLGTNDLFDMPDMTAGKIRDRMKKMLAFVSELREEKSTAGILLIAPPPVRVFETKETERVSRESGKLGRLYGTLSEELSLSFADAGGWDISLSFDGIHFSEEGHAKFAAAMERILTV